jgi:hypothetical protein
MYPAEDEITAYGRNSGLVALAVRWVSALIVTGCEPVGTRGAGLRGSVNDRPHRYTRAGNRHPRRAQIPGARTPVWRSPPRRMAQRGSSRTVFREGERCGPGDTATPAMVSNADRCTDVPAHATDSCGDASHPASGHPGRLANHYLPIVRWGVTVGDRSWRLFLGVPRICCTRLVGWPPGRPPPVADGRPMAVQIPV